MSSDRDPDRTFEAELKHLCLENGYKAPLHRWQLRLEHVATSCCLLLVNYFEDGSPVDVLHNTGIPRSQLIIDLSS